MPTEVSLISKYSDLEGKVALVTGGSRGIGAATCMALARNGAKVAVNGRDEAAIDAVVASIKALGGTAFAAPADCADLAAVQAMQRKVVDALGAPELLLPFAGGGSSKPMPFCDISEQDWRSSLDQNLTSTFFVLKTFLPAMLARGSGAIVTMASAGGRVAAGAPAAYGAAKAGIIMLTRHLAAETGASGIRVNCISPSAIMTERTAARIPPERQQQMRAAFPLGRLGQAEDVAAAALFLLSSASAWITGATMDVAGGRVMS